MRITKSKCWHCKERVVEMGRGAKPMHTSFVGRDCEPYEWCRSSKATPEMGTYETMEI